VSVGPGRLSPGWFFGVVAFGGVGMAMTAPVTALYAKELGASDAVAAVIVSSIALSFLCLDLVASRVVPRVDARLALAGGYLVWASGSLASALAPNLAVMAGARVVQGFAAAFPMAAAFRVALRLARPGQEGAAVARFNVASFMGLAVGPLLSAAITASIAGETGMRWSFGICGVLNVMAAALTLRMLPPIPADERPQFGWPPRRAFAGRRTRLALLAAGVAFGLRGVVGLTLVPLLGDDIGVTATTVAVATTVMAAGELVGSVLAGRGADRWGRLPVTAGAAAVVAVAILLTMVSPSAPVLLVMCGVLGFTMAAIYVVPAVVVADVAETSDAATIGWRASCDVNSVTTAGLLVVVLGLTDLEGGFVCAALLTALVGVLAVCIGETRRAPASPVLVPEPGPAAS
jgi:DHA1 family inner membrane transport protein